MNRTLTPRPNPLFSDNYEKQIRIALAEVAQSTKYSTAERERVIRRLLGAETARQAIEGLAPGVDIFGLTCGQFSLVHLLFALIEKIGPCSLDLTTWTAATADVTDMMTLIQSEKLRSMRMIVDMSFLQRKPAVLKEIIKRFGRENIRITNSHAKFALLENKRWKVVLKTSMNLNQNPRMEDFDLTCNPELFGFLRSFVDGLFALTPADAGVARSSMERWKEFIARWMKNRK